MILRLLYLLFCQVLQWLALLSCIDFDGTQERVSRKRVRAKERSRGEDWS